MNREKQKKLFQNIFYLIVLNNFIFISNKKKNLKKKFLILNFFFLYFFTIKYTNVISYIWMFQIKYSQLILLQKNCKNSFFIKKYLIFNSYLKNNLLFYELFNFNKYINKNIFYDNFKEKFKFFNNFYWFYYYWNSIILKNHLIAVNSQNTIIKVKNLWNFFLIEDENIRFRLKMDEHDGMDWMYFSIYSYIELKKLKNNNIKKNLKNNLKNYIEQAFLKNRLDEINSIQKERSIKYNEKLEKSKINIKNRTVDVVALRKKIYSNFINRTFGSINLYNLKKLINLNENYFSEIIVLSDYKNNDLFYYYYLCFLSKNDYKNDCNYNFYYYFILIYKIYEFYKNKSELDINEELFFQEMDEYIDFFNFNFKVNHSFVKKFTFLNFFWKLIIYWNFKNENLNNFDFLKYCLFLKKTIYLKYLNQYLILDKINYFYKIKSLIFLRFFLKKLPIYCYFFNKNNFFEKNNLKILKDINLKKKKIYINFYKIFLTQSKKKINNSLNYVYKNKYIYDFRKNSELRSHLVSLNYFGSFSSFSKFKIFLFTSSGLINNMIYFYQYQYEYFILKLMFLNCNDWKWIRVYLTYNIFQEKNANLLFNFDKIYTSNFIQPVNFTEKRYKALIFNSNKRKVNIIAKTISKLILIYFQKLYIGNFYISFEKINWKTLNKKLMLSLSFISQTINFELIRPNFIQEFIFICVSTFSTGDPKFLLRWIIKVLHKISFKKHWKFLYQLKQNILRVSRKFIELSKFSGLHVIIKGKIGALGCVRKKTVHIKIGSFGLSRYYLQGDMLYSSAVTQTGKIGVKIITSYK